MRSAIVFFLVASTLSSVAFASLAGLAHNKPLTENSREDRFDIVTINPTTGQASSTQKQIYALYDGTLDITNVLVGNSEWALSLQAFDAAQVQGYTSTTPLVGAQTSNPVNPAAGWAYLARQDLRFSGRYEYCQLSSSQLPINIFWDSDRSVIATIAVTSSTSFAIARIAFNDNSAFCQYTVLATLPAITSISANVKAQRGNRIIFVTEPSTGFTSTAAAVTIRTYDISATRATAVNSVTLANGLIPTHISATSDSTVILQGWNSQVTTTAAGFVTYEINLATYTTTIPLASRGTVSVSEEISFATTYVNQTNVIASLKNVYFTSATATATDAQPWVVTTSFATTGTSEIRTTNALNALNIFNLFDLQNATISTIDTDTVSSASTVNSVVLTGSFIYAGIAAPSTTNGAINRAPVSTCRVTFTNAGATSATTYEVTANGNFVATGNSFIGLNSASCPLTTVPTAAGTPVSVQFAADGVNYGPATVFSFNGAVATGRFLSTAYTLRDGTPLEANAEKVAIELLDSAGRKILFTGATTTVTINASVNGAAVLRSITGNVAVARHGLAVFPNLAIDVDAADSTDIAVITLSVDFNNNNKAISTANVGIIRSTRGTLAALTLPTLITSTIQIFETHVVNPTASNSVPALKLGTRSLQDASSISANSIAPALALGLTAYDRDNKVLNTVEVRADGTPILNGISISGSGTRGTGVCIIPRSTTSRNDIPTSIWYESTNQITLATTFLAIVQNTDLTTGAGIRLVRYTRSAASSVTSTCAITLVDLIPVFDSGYGNHQVIPLTNGRIAFVENDYFFTATGNNIMASNALSNAIISVWKYTVTSTATNTATPGTWLIRNKIFNGPVVSVTQSATDELAIATSVWGSTNSNTIALVSIAAESILNAGTTATQYATTSSDADQAVFLAAGTSETFADNRFRYQATNYTGKDYVDTIQLSRGTITPRGASSIERSGRNYIDFFNIDDPVVTSLTPNAVARGSTSSITATVNNVIQSSQLKCRFVSGAITPVEVTISATLTTVTMAADGTAVNCGTIPAQFANQDAFVYVQVSNDGGNNYGPEGKLIVGNPAPIGGSSTTASGTTTITSTTNTFYRVFGEYTTSDANTAALNNYFTVTVLNAINAAGVGSFRIASPFSNTASSTNGRSAYTITYGSIATTNRLAALQSASSQIAAVQTAANSNQALLTAAGATVNVQAVTGTNAVASATGTNGLSQGAIAGIVIACVVGFLIIVGAIAFFVLNSNKAKSNNFAQSRNYDARAGSSSSSSSSSSDDYSDYSDYSTDDYSDYV